MKSLTGSVGVVAPESILSFLKERRKSRGWLHTQTTFNLLHWFIGFPGALWVVYRVGNWIVRAADNPHPALLGALYVYLFLLTLLIFRLLIWVVRWTLPVVELDAARSKRTRGLIGAGLSSLFLALIYDVLRTLF